MFSTALKLVISFLLVVISLSQVQAVNAQGTTTGTGPQCQGQITITNLSYSGSRVFVAWNPMSGATQYEVILTGTGDTEQSQTTIEPEVTFDNLNIVTSTYIVSIQGKNSTGNCGQVVTRTFSEINIDDSQIRQSSQNSSAIAQATDPASNSTGGSQNSGASGAGSTLNSSYGPMPHTVYTISNVINTIAGCLTIGQSLWFGSLPVAGCSVIDPTTGQLKITEKVEGGGAMGATTKVMAALYDNPPASSKEYLAYMGSNLGLVDTAYAQVGGSGNNVLTPILKLWLFFRNLALLLFIVIFIVVGFMIMLRRRLNPQTVVTIQSALPGLVIGIILVYFSYFVAALIVDTSFVGMKVVAYVFSASETPNIFNNPAAGPDNTPEKLAEGNLLHIFGAFLQNNRLSAEVIAPLSEEFNAKNLFEFLGVLNPQQAQSARTESFGSLIFGGNIGGVAANVIDILPLGWLLGILLSAIIILALLIQMLRLLWALISAYITILIFTIAGPFFILVGSIPGRGAAITYWWTSILGNVLIFPAVFFVILFAGVFLSDATQFTYTMPLFVGLPITLIKAIIAYGLLLASPAVPGLVKQALGVKDITALQQAAFGGGAGAGAVFGKFGEKAWEPYRRRAEALREGAYRRMGEDYAQQRLSQGRGFAQPLANIIYGVPRIPQTKRQTPTNPSTQRTP